jgi:curved DNA-binding protein
MPKMREAPFIDFYELLELSPKASLEAIEQLFRVAAKRYHPETGIQKDAEKFKLITHAFQTLRDPARRSAYDSLYVQFRREAAELIRGAEATADDYAVRNRMLDLFYSQRRRSMKQPGVGVAKLEELLAVSPDIIEFHLWYFKEKGWVQRETSGPLSITVAGVDEIESRERLKQAAGRTPIAPITMPVGNAAASFAS